MRMDDRRDITMETDAEPAGRFPHLVIVEGYGTGGIFPLTKETTAIGRDPKGDLVLPYPTVSWHHASVVVELDRILVRDLDSRNGTFVGVDRITHREITEGDFLAIGDSVVLKLTFRSRLDDRAATAPGFIAHDSIVGVANAAALLDRLRTERSLAQDEGISLVLLFIRIEGVVEEAMQRTAAIVRGWLGADDLLARAADRELIVLLRSTIEGAERTAKKLQLTTAKALPEKSSTMTAALVPIPARTALPPEAILLLASRKARQAMTVAPTKILLISLEDPGRH
jgi:GGDEF domain-containing protein